MESTTQDVRKYRLKGIALLRMFVEIAGLVMLLVMPAMLHFAGKLALLPQTGKIAVFALAVVALCILPCFGFVTFLVTTSSAGLTTIAAFSKQSCRWDEVREISKRSSYNWLRYVVELENKTTLTFPVLLNSCDQLVAEVRSHIPGAGAGVPRSPYRAFAADPFALAFQLLEAFVGVFFLFICWVFCASVMKGTNSSDVVTIVVFCVVCSIALLWRTYVVALMPKVVNLEPDRVSIRTLFYEKHYDWADMVSVKPPFPLLPEGFMLKTRKGSYLIGSGMNQSDELQQTISQRLPKPASTK